jgi:hypothetical protein
MGNHIHAGGIAAALLWLVLVAGPACAEDYRRADWMPSGWEDADGDCQDTRQEVLIRDAVGPVTLSADGCRVVAGTWVGPYTGKTFTDPRELDIDHIVPLAEAHASGGAEWAPAKKRAFANWMPGLVAVEARANRVKGAKDPAGWMPTTHRCFYSSVWRWIKAQWGLTMDFEEHRAVAEACEP